MQTMWESWTDGRPDDLAKRMDERFDRVDKEFARIDTDIRELRRMMAQGFVTLIGITVTGFFSLAGLMVL